MTLLEIERDGKRIKADLGTWVIAIYTVLTPEQKDKMMEILAKNQALR